MSCKRLIFFLVLIFTNAFSEVYNEIDKDYSVNQNEKGLHFYKEQDARKKDAEIPAEKNNENVFSEILKELKEQKKSINKMKNFINPNESHYITNSKGVRCLSNSNDDCIVIPIIQEARNVPALKNFIENPTPENAQIWLKVQAKFFNHYRDMGFALRFAALNGNEDTYGVSGGDIYTSPKDNFNNEQFRTKILQTLKENVDKVGTLFLLGKSEKIEQVWGKQSLSRLAFGKGKYFNSAIAFYDEKTKIKYDNYYSKISDKELFEVYRDMPKVVNKKLFQKYHANVTPTAVAIYQKEDNEEPIFSVLAKGFITQNELIHSYHNFLVYNKIVEPKEFHSAKLWDASVEDKK